tara:strand:- start:277 stop:441 length:165 start_codon:yes stop_codon:yes gene_type:complete
MENSDAILSLMPTRLKEARRAKGLSIKAVAKLSGVSRSMAGKTIPNMLSLLPPE